MINKTFRLFKDEKSSLVSYVLDDGELSMKGRLHPCVVICPGGGYTYVSKNEGEPVAAFFNSKGYDAFVLNYSVKINHPFPEALSELAIAIAFIRDKAKEWLIDSTDITVVGFSAGGNLALSLGVNYGKAFLNTISAGATAAQIKPNALILGYPAVCLDSVSKHISKEAEDLISKGIIPDFRGPSIQEILIGKENPTSAEKEHLNLLNYITSAVPPVFAWNTYEDKVVPPTDTLRLGMKLIECHVPCEIHMFQRGAHGLSLADKTVKDKDDLRDVHASDWKNEALSWLEELRNSRRK
jgi:acetyl esterase/lipase